MKSSAYSINFHGNYVFRVIHDGGPTFIVDKAANGKSLNKLKHP